MPTDAKAEFIKRIQFPPYALACVGDRYVIVGGGGGAAKTGVKNKFDVYQLYHNGQQTTARCVLSHDVGDYCISNLTAWLHDDSPSHDDKAGSGYTTPCPIINLAIGREESCVILKLVPKLVAEQNGEQHMMPNKQDNTGSSTRRRQYENGATRPGPQNTYYTFTVIPVCTFKTTFSAPTTTTRPADVYQKVCRASLDGRQLATGGTDGNIRLWQLHEQEPRLLHTIQAHDKEVDQLDLSPDGKQVVSVCRAQRECAVWRWQGQGGSKVMQLVLDTQPVKYKFAWARYGIVEGNTKDVRLFTISNPVSGSKNPGIIAKWCGKQYALQRRQAVEGVLSNLALSGDGRYLATGTMDGDVLLVVAFSLQMVKRVAGAHAMFVTGVSWLDGRTRSSCIVRGFSDASVLSVSCDNTLRICHVPAVTMMPVWLVAVLAAVVLALTFIVASYVGL